MRLDRFIESKLSCSAQSVRNLFVRREVLLNGVAVSEGRGQISEFCTVEVAGQVLQAQQAYYLMFHKPRACVSATCDKKNPTVIDIVDFPQKALLHLAGRLDFNTTGLLLLTNDGKWSRKLTQPTQKIPKTYWVEVESEITEDYVEQFAQGIYFAYEDLTTQPAQLTILTSHTAHLTLYEGRYHQVKRMFGFFNNAVLNLHRLSMGNIFLDESLKPGEFRHLTPEEVASV